MWRPVRTGSRDFLRNGRHARPAPGYSLPGWRPSRPHRRQPRRSTLNSPFEPRESVSRTHEAVLTSAVIERPEPVLATSSSDHALVVLTEVELGIGRPDSIVLADELATLFRRRAAGLRLANLTEARVLGALMGDSPASATSSERH